MLVKTNREKFESSKLYCVTQAPPQGGCYQEMVELACKGGADIVQLREKNLLAEDLIALAKDLNEVCHRYGTLFIVNDFLEVALASGADGVHLGQEDLSLLEARKIVGQRDFLIGCSTHSLEQAFRAESLGADYVACGPIFATPTKPGRAEVGLELVKKYSKSIRVPFVAIGGIDLENIEEVLQAGAKRVAVVRAVFGASNIEESARFLKDKIISHVNK